jgi:acyl-coenzyme A thioesterase PaaI-like protein
MTSEQARRRVAVQLRDLADRLVTDDVDDATWQAVQGHLAGAASALPANPPDRTRFARDHVELGAGVEDSPSARHPLGLGTSGIYPPFAITHEDDVLVATTTFGPAFEGPPGLVHGGFLAAGFDIMLSAMAHHRVGTSVTRRLTVRYLKPTLLGAPLRYEIRAGEPDDRLLDLEGTLLADGRVTMRATAQFATMSGERFARHGETPP